MCLRAGRYQLPFLLNPSAHVRAEAAITPYGCCIRQAGEDPGVPFVSVACHGRPDVSTSLWVAGAYCVRTCVDVTPFCAGTFPENPQCRYKRLSKNESDDVHHKNVPCMSEYQQQLHHIHKQASSVRGPRRPGFERCLLNAAASSSHHCVPRSCRRMIASRWRKPCRRVWP